MRKTWLIIFILVLVGVVGFCIYHAVTKTTMGLILVGDVASSNTLVDNLSNSDRDLVMTSLDLLSARGDVAGKPEARKLLGSSDDYIWFNAALYLGAIKDPDAVPYLIKGLKHPAWGAYPAVVRELEALTGETLGMDQAKWIEWWNHHNPSSGFSFSYASLVKQAAEIHTGSNILITHVIDPIHVSYLGSPIVLIGIRLKAGASEATATRLLETAMSHQFAGIERDGKGLTADGSVPALIDWEPDPINNPSMMAISRTGLGTVPFTHRTSLQEYLLRSGFYELDLDTVQDPAMRAKVQAFVSVMAPGGPATTSEASK